MTFEVDINSSSYNSNSRMRMFSILLKISIALTVTLCANSAFAERIKLAVFPVNNKMDLSASQRNYLYDVIREAASASAGSYISLIHQQKIKSLGKKKKGHCNEDCAIKSAASVGARIALIVEIEAHESQVMGVIKLLDVQEEVLLTMKRFFSPTVEDAEQELQGAVMFVLSAQFLPMNDADRTALQAEQQNLPAAYARPAGAMDDQQTSPSQPTPPPTDTLGDSEEQQPEFTYSTQNITQPNERANPKAYLVTSIVTGTIAVGMGVGAILFGHQLSVELKNKDTENLKKGQLEYDYISVYTGQNNPVDGVAYLTEEKFNDYWAPYNLTFDDRTSIDKALTTLSNNINEIDDKIVLNGTMTGILGTFALGAAVFSVVFAIKYAKASKNPQALNTPRLYVSPIFSRDLNGAVFGASF